MTTNNANMSKNVSAIDTIQRDPQAVLLGTESGAAQVLRNKELRIAVRYYATLGKTPAARAKAVSAKLGDTPTREGMAKVAVAIGKHIGDLLDTTDKEGNRVEPRPQRLNNATRAAVAYVAIIATQTAEVAASLIDRTNNKTAQSVGSILSETTSKHDPLASWDELPALVDARADATTAARKGSKGDSEGDSAGGSAQAGDKDCDIAAIRQRVKGHIAGLRGWAEGLQLTVAQRRKGFDMIMLAMAETLEMLGGDAAPAQAAPKPAKPAKPAKPGK